MRRAPAAALAGAAALLAALAVAAPAHAQDADQGGGAQVGGSVSSTLSLGLAQSGSTVTAVVTSTEPGARLDVTPSGVRTDLSATVVGAFLPVDPLLGLRLMAWHDVLAGQATTIRLKSSSRAPSTALITLSAPTP